MCRHTGTSSKMAGLQELPPLASKAPTGMLACWTQGGFDLFDAVLGSPVADMPQPGAPASPASKCWPSPGGSSHPPPQHAQEGAVQRCLFSSTDTACCSTLPRLIVPAAPFTTCYGGSPMQLPSTPPSQAVDIRRRRQQQEEPQCMQEWLANMELALSVGSRNNRGLPGDACTGVSPSAAAPTAAAGQEGSHWCRNTPGVDLPPPAFALLGVLQE